jgi:hypothetical protein
VPGRLGVVRVQALDEAADKMKKIDLRDVKSETGSNYPTPFDLPCSIRSRERDFVDLSI